MKKRAASNWIKALRSGKYKQGTGSLKWQDGNTIKHCCLGVLCEVNGLKGWLSSDGEFKFGREHLGSSVPESVKDKVGLHGHEGQLLEFDGKSGDDDDYICIDGRYYDSLADANDKGVSFAQIADYIEINYKRL